MAQRGRSRVVVSGGKRRVNRRFVRAIIAIIAAVAVLYAPYWWLHRALPYDANRWRGARSIEEHELRFRMVRDVNAMIRAGQINSKQTARAVLGPPDAGEAGGSWHYDLGPEHAALFRIDHDW